MNSFLSVSSYSILHGSHRQFKHPEKPSTVTVAGNLGVDVPIGTLQSIWRQALLTEKTEENEPPEEED